MADTISEQYDEVWEQFQEARLEFYRSPRQEAAERGLGRTGTASGAQAEKVLDRSAALRGVLEEAIAGDDSDLADLAAIKLLAAAAYDLSIAGALLEQEEHGGSPIERSPHLDPELQGDLNQILDLPLDDAGLKSMAQTERGALPLDFGPACDELNKEVSKCLKEIPANSIHLAGQSIGGAISFASPLSGWETALENEFLNKIPGSISWAAKAAVEALQKLWSALGKEQKAQMLDQVKEWLEQAKEKGTETAADWLFQIPVLEHDLTKKVREASPSTPAGNINGGTRRLAQLRGRYAKTKTVLAGVLKVISFIKAPLLAAPPWGPAAAYAVYTLTFGYAIYSGGDYLDSPRFTSIDIVRGVYSSVSQAVA
jgi:hypothetical protein